MSRLPSLFVSHGAPTFALSPGKAGPLLRALGERLPRPRAIALMSPHWMTRGLRVCTQATTKTLHDFGGFPEPLYALRYEPPGAPDVAQQALSLLQQAGFAAQGVPSRALDHGAWVPLMYLFPKVDIPVFQISMPHDLTPDRALALGAALRPLADEGVLIVGSGSLTHNLYEVQMYSEQVAPYVTQFVSWVRAAVQANDFDALAQIMTKAPHAARAHPSPDHLLPLHFAAGAAQPNASNHALEGGVEHGILSMESYVFGEITNPPSQNALST